MEGSLYSLINTMGFRICKPVKMSVFRNNGFKGVKSFYDDIFESICQTLFLREKTEMGELFLKVHSFCIAFEIMSLGLKSESFF